MKDRNTSATIDEESREITRLAVAASNRGDETPGQREREDEAFELVCEALDMDDLASAVDQFRSAWFLKRRTGGD